MIAVTGTQREASVLGNSGATALVIAGNGETLALLLAERDKPAALISFGMAGALDPGLRLGDWVIGSEVCGEGACDATLIARLASQFQHARQGACLGSGSLIAGVDEKAALFRRHGALAVDMESHHVARAARRLGVPFAVLRCISDEAGYALPPAIAVAMRPDGGLALGAVLASLVRQPGQTGDLVRTLRGFAAAFALMKTDAAGLRLG